ncbi:Lysophospholipase L1 [Bacillus sp. cl95]|nr:Lysophospholipase L1 [Bacillus sp. cl95]
MISFLFLCMWLIGLGWSINDYYAGKPKSITVQKKEDKNVEKKKAGEMTIVALGDSLTRGTGDESGKGYVGYVKEEISERAEEKLQFLNLGINGQRSEQLRSQITQSEVQRQLKGANFVFITIGGNDLFRGGQGLMDMNLATINETRKKYLDNIRFIFQEVRKTNQDATIFFIGLYNPFIDLDEGKDISKIIRQWNYESAEVSAEFPKVVFVPTFDLFELKVNDYLYSDKFHPNAKGYRLIAQRVASLMTW